MNNLIPSHVQMHEKYDLKGSTYKRRANSQERRKESPTWKDLDFMERYPDGFLLDVETYNAVVKTVQRDCRVSDDGHGRTNEFELLDAGPRKFPHHGLFIPHRRSSCRPTDGTLRSKNDVIPFTGFVLSTSRHRIDYQTIFSPRRAVSHIEQADAHTFVCSQSKHRCNPNA